MVLVLLFSVELVVVDFGFLLVENLPAPRGLCFEESGRFQESDLCCFLVVVYVFYAAAVVVVPVVVYGCPVG